MSEFNDGGSAFPPHARSTADEYMGMSLRDYFAAKELSSVDGVRICDMPSAYDRLADHCYRMADAMLRAREHQK